jgi:hypothetical protein
MPLMAYTPAELAEHLDNLRYCPHSTGSLSMLDEATLAYGGRYPEVDGPQRAFAAARYAHMQSYRTETCRYSDEAWQRAVDAARALAKVLRPLGDSRIERCKRQAGWGVCNLPLGDDGVCCYQPHVEQGHGCH